jgi:hypothetical protein
VSTNMGSVFVQTTGVNSVGLEKEEERAGNHVPSRWPRGSSHGCCGVRTVPPPGHQN